MTRAFGVRGFQLALLPRMADLAPARVEAALEELAATRADMRWAHRRWLSLAYVKRAPAEATRLRWALGPAKESAERRFGDLTCEVSWWELPLWPGLLFEALIAPDGSVWNQWLVRPPGSAAPGLDGPADLTPWSCVVSDVGERFPGAEHIEGSAPSRWGVSFAYEGTSYEATFVYGLLQAVTRSGG